MNMRAIKNKPVALIVDDDAMMRLLIRQTWSAPASSVTKP